MIRTSFAALPLALVACNSQPAVVAENASIAEVAAKAQGAAKIEPGEWSHTTEVLALDMPGIADAGLKKMMGDAMKAQQNKPVTYCVTKEDAEQPTFGAGKGDNGDCRYERFKMVGGAIDAVMICKPKSGGGMTMAMTGDYDPTRYTMTVAMKIEGGTGHPGGMSMKVKSNGKRVGACKA